MPKLRLTTWIIIGVVQVVYGLIVFSVTRSYYLEERTALKQTASSVPGIQPQRTKSSLGSSIQRMGEFVTSPADLASDDPKLLARLGDSYFAEKNYEQAIKLYERTLKLNPDDIDTYNDLGLSLHYTGQTVQAVNTLKAGVAKAPGFQRIYLTLGFVQSQSGDRKGAIAAFSKAIELNPDNTIGQEAKRMLGELE